MSKHNELKDKNTALSNESAKLQQNNKKLNDEVSELKRSKDALIGEIQALRKVSDFYYQRGMEHLAGKNYRTATEYFELILDRHPLDAAAGPSRERLREIAAISAENYKRIIRDIDSAKDPKAKLEILNRNISERFLTKDDNVELYIVQNFSGKKRYRIRARYIGDNWISYDSISLRGDNVSHIDIVCKYSEKLSKMSEDKIYEWSDNDVDEGRINSLLKSGTITVRFGGGYRFMFSLNDEQLTAFREIAKKYSTLR